MYYWRKSRKINQQYKQKILWPVPYIQIVSACTQETEKAMAPHSSTLAWRIPWMEEPGRLQSMESLRVGHDWVISLSLFTFMQWRRKWQPTPVFLPGESQGWGSLVGCHLRDRTESDTTEATYSSSSTQEKISHYMLLTSMTSDPKGSWRIGEVINQSSMA